MGVTYSVLFSLLCIRNMEVTQPIEDTSSETVSDTVAQENHETRDEMLSRHR